MPETAPPVELLQRLAPPDEPSTRAVIAGEPDGQPAIGLVLKRTYRIGSRGGWEPVGEDDQELVLDEEVDYDEAEPPFCAAVAHGNDVLFRPATDIVVQGSAFAYERPAGRTTVRVRLGQLRRDIAVHGNRRVERKPGGGLRFSEPEPFESMPIRYDRAYGGVDLRAFLENPSPLVEDLKRALPGVPFDQASPYHYPRNPAGVGFVLSTARDPDELLVPNLELDIDPVTIDRLAIGATDNWPAAPLPASMDWSSAAWFPRIAYLGAHGLPAGWAGRVLERELGWVPPDILDIPPPTAAPGAPIRPAFGQGASPGMTLSDLTVDAIRSGVPVRLVHLHPAEPALRMELPREWPIARLALRPSTLTELAPSMSAVVIRPADQEVVMLWCARAPREREYTPEQYAAMRSRVEWRRDPR